METDTKSFGRFCISVWAGISYWVKSLLLHNKLDKIKDAIAVWSCSLGSKIGQISNLVESQNWSGLDSGHVWTIGKLEEFGNFVNHMNLMMICLRMGGIWVSKLSLQVTQTHITMVDSGDAGPSKKFRDHTQLIKTSKQALTLTEHNFLTVHIFI